MSTQYETRARLVDYRTTNDRLLDSLESLLLKLGGRDLSEFQLDRMARILYWRGERMVIDEARDRAEE